ncbi:MAG: polymerase, sigma-24 subunit, subfamily [Sphingobacteriales bacterium]|nr:polymerase, sigma-24 subunit, subfamily [Sphingobacteriales bacterium]
MPNLENLSDKELLDFLKKDHADAFEEIFNRHWSNLYSAAYKRIRNKETAEEIVQDLFTSIWFKRSTLEIEGSIAAYFSTAVRYRVLNHIYKETIRENHKESLMLVSNNSDTSTEDIILVNDLNRNIQKEISQLPEKCRSVFELSRKEHKSNREIAEFLGISEKTVENHLTKAIRRLRVGLADISRIASLLL